MQTRFHPRFRSAARLAAGLTIGVPLSAFAQATPPATDIWIAELRDEGPLPEVGVPENLTARAGYDNQPHFTPDGGAFLYTSIGDEGRADTWRWDLATGEANRVTRTSPESEYSPTPMPGGDRFSVVRVEADSTQRLWSFRIDGSDPRLLLPQLAPVGYHAWADEGRVVLFVLGDPPTLRIATLATGEAPIVAEGVGRSLQRVPETGEVSFVRKLSEEEWWVEALDPGSGETRRLVRTPPGAEDHAWTPASTLLMGAGTKLYAWSARTAAGAIGAPGRRPGEVVVPWREVADLGDAGLGAISRLAVSPDGRWIALVAEPDAP